MWRAKIAIAVVSMCLALAGSGFSQSANDALELLRRVRETYRNVTSYQLEGTITMETKVEGIEVKMEIPFSYAVHKPDAEAHNRTGGGSMVRIRSERLGVERFAPENRRLR